MKYLVTDIIYDTDGEDINLPNEIEINVPDGINGDEADEYISDKICEITGFCHKGFSVTPKIIS